MSGVEPTGTVIRALGADSLRDLQRLSIEGKVALLIRHSEREEFPREDRNTPLEATRQLTPRGREAAREYGRRIPAFDHIFVTHTPVPRARDTAQEILAGLCSSTSPTRGVLSGVDPTLSLARHYARNLSARHDLRERLGGKQFLRAWLDGGIPSSVLPSAPETVRSFVRSLGDRVRSGPNSSLHLGVTHDYDLLVLREVLFGLRFEDTPWIGFLEGILLEWDQDSRVMAIWRGTKSTLTI